MKHARMIGNYVEHLIKRKGFSNAEFAKYIGCDENQLNRFFKGMVLASYSQLSKMAEICDVSVCDILEGDEEEYNNSFSDKFDNPENREIILDIIDDYIDVIEALKEIKDS